MSTTPTNTASMSASLGRNMRRTVRVAVNMHLKIVRLNDQAKKIIPGYARNISEGGIAAFVPVHFSMEERLLISFTLPGTKLEVSVRAFVRSVERSQYGLEFLKMDETAKRLITEHCQEFHKLRPA